MEVQLTRGLEENKEFGKISKIELPNKSKIYISKKGWNLITPDGKEINIPYCEINLAIKETIQQGYTSISPTDFSEKFWCYYVPSLFTLFVIVIITILVLNTQKQHYIESKQYCNNLYGYDNWYWKETTGKGICKDYIGQCWRCFPKEEIYVS